MRTRSHGRRCRPHHLLLLAALAATTGAEEARHHEAHEHGHGRLSVAVDGDLLLAELRVPAVNVTGFEHAARDAAERRAVTDAIARFEAVETLLLPSAGAGCEVEHRQVAIGGLGNRDEHGHDHEHEHDAEAGEEDGAGHAELHAAWRWYCETPERLVALEVNVFTALQGMQAIDAQVVTATLQAARELTADQRSLPLAP